MCCCQRLHKSSDTLPNVPIAKRLFLFLPFSDWLIFSRFPINGVYAAPGPLRAWGVNKIFTGQLDTERQHAISTGPLQIFHSSEVSLGYDSSLKWRGHFLGHQVHGLLPCAGQPRQEVQILPYHWLHLHLLLGCQGGQGYLASKDEEESVYTKEECQA